MDGQPANQINFVIDTVAIAAHALERSSSGGHTQLDRLACHRTQ